MDYLVGPITSLFLSLYDIIGGIRQNPPPSYGDFCEYLSAFINTYKMINATTSFSILKDVNQTKCFWCVN